MRLLRFPNTSQKLLPLAIDLLGIAVIDSAAADGRRGEAFAAEAVLAEQLELGRIGCEDDRPAAFVGRIEVLAREDQRAAEGAADAALPGLFARVALPAHRHARVEDRVQVSAGRDHRRDIDPRTVFPGRLARAV